jgi:hypothetical protein
MVANVVLKPASAGVTSLLIGSASVFSACTTNAYRCGGSPLGGAAPQKSLVPMSLRTWKAPSGSPVPSALPTPAASSVTDAGMPYTIQCQKPDPVGASGSKQVTAKPLVSAGNPDQRRCGDRFSPVAPNPLNTCLLVNCSPSATSSLSTVNDGTGGRKSYGSGGCSVMVFLLGRSGFTWPAPTLLSRRGPRHPPPRHRIPKQRSRDGGAAAVGAVPEWARGCKRGWPAAGAPEIPT